MASSAVPNTPVKLVVTVSSVVLNRLICSANWSTVPATPANVRRVEASSSEALSAFVRMLSIRSRLSSLSRLPMPSTTRSVSLTNSGASSDSVCSIDRPASITGTAPSSGASNKGAVGVPGLMPTNDTPVTPCDLMVARLSVRTGVSADTSSRTVMVPSPSDDRRTSTT